MGPPPLPAAASFADRWLQLVVTAHLADGQVEDVTYRARFAVKDAKVARVERALVHSVGLGDTQVQVALARCPAVWGVPCWAGHPWAHVTIWHGDPAAMRWLMCLPCLAAWVSTLGKDTQ